MTLGRQQLLWPAAFLCFALLALPQAAFIWMSLHADLGLGQFGEGIGPDNYVELVTEPFYLRSISLTIGLSVATVVAGLVLSFPTAYVLARVGGWVASVIISLILTTSLITIVVKVILVRSGGVSGWILPVAGGVLFAILVGVWSTSALYVFSVNPFGL